MLLHQDAFAADYQEDECALALRRLTQFCTRHKVLKRSHDEKTRHLIMTKSLPPPMNFFAGAPASYYYDLDSRDEVGFARKLGKPILILHGDRDYHVIDEDITVWRMGLKGAQNVHIETLPGLNHYFIAGNGKPGPDEYSIPCYVAPEVIERTSNFTKTNSFGTDRDWRAWGNRSTVSK